MKSKCNSKITQKYLGFLNFTSGKLMDFPTSVKITLISEAHKILIFGFWKKCWN
jgi:hypothetical protein